jgi:hypothetical protein
VAVIDLEEVRDPYKAPRDADEFERQEGPRLRRLIYRNLGGLRPPDAADAAADIMEKLVQKQIWAQYGDVESRHTGKRVTWKHYVSQLAVRYCLGKYEQYGKKFTREPLTVDTTVGSGSSTWGEMNGPRHEDSYPSVEELEFIEHVRDWLAIHPVMPAPWPCSMLEVIDAMLERASRSEPFSVQFLSRHFSIPMAEARKIMALLREMITQARAAREEIHKVVLGGVEITAADLAVALGRLKKLTGNRVAPAFGDHPLALAEPRNRWYVTLARQEIKTRPELKQPIGRHAAGTKNGGHSTQVKDALIAAFERMLMEAGAPAPEPPVTLADEFESRLHRMGVPGMTLPTIEALRKAFIDTVE